ncbi:MAG TPA: sigma-70 family RNA polymerase sigma factor [Ktedonobacterales bacterium]
MSMWGERTLTGQDFEDAELVARIVDGDVESLGAIYDRYQRPVYSLCLRVTHDRGAAEEVMQEVFVRLWKSAASFEPGRGRVSAWLLRIAHNLSLNEVRRRSSRPVIAYEADWEVESGGVADADVQDDPAMAAWLTERAIAIRRALGELPAPQRQAIELAFFDGLTQAEIAAATGDPLGTVKSRIRIGMQRLRDVLIAAGIDEVN